MAAIAAILDCRSEQCLLFLLYKTSWCIRPMSSQLAFWFRRRSELDFQDSSHSNHPGFRIGMILAIFDLHSDASYQVNWPFASGEVKNGFPRWQPRRPSWIFDCNCFSYFWSTSHSDASYQLHINWLIVLGFNDTSTLVGHFVSSPREREKRDRRDSRRNEREGQGRKRNRNESEETEEIKTSPPNPYLLQG